MINNNRNQEWFDIDKFFKSVEKGMKTEKKKSGVMLTEGEFRRDTQKETSKKKNYLSKEVLYDGMKRYHELRDKLDGITSMRGSSKVALRKELKKTRDEMLVSYEKLARGITRGYSYAKVQEADKDDMVMFAIIRGLSIGVEGKQSYGKEYWSRFDYKNRYNVFAFWTTQIRNFFRIWFNAEKKYQGIKYDVLDEEKNQFFYDASELYGIKGIAYPKKEDEDYEDNA